MVNATRHNKHPRVQNRTVLAMVGSSGEKRQPEVYLPISLCWCGLFIDSSTVVVSREASVGHPQTTRQRTRKKSIGGIGVATFRLGNQVGCAVETNVPSQRRSVLHVVKIVSRSLHRENEKRPVGDSVSFSLFRRRPSSSRTMRSSISETTSENLSEIPGEIAEIVVSASLCSVSL